MVKNHQDKSLSSAQTKAPQEILKIQTAKIKEAPKEQNKLADN